MPTPKRYRARKDGNLFDTENNKEIAVKDWKVVGLSLLFMDNNGPRKIARYQIDETDYSFGPFQNRDGEIAVKSATALSAVTHSVTKSKGNRGGGNRPDSTRADRLNHPRRVDSGPRSPAASRRLHRPQDHLAHQSVVQ